MKKLITVGSLLTIFAISFTSCKKDYTCECILYSVYNGVSAEQERDNTTIKGKKDDAKTTCENLSNSDITGGIGYKEECAIK